MEPFETEFTHVEQKKSMAGCIAIGCVTVLLVTVLTIAGVCFGFYYYVDSQVKTYTSAEPIPMPRVIYSESEIEEVQEKFTAIQDAIKNDEPPPSIELSADDINAMIQQNESLRDMVYVEIEDGEIRCSISIPLDKFDIPLGLGNGRYINGSADIDIYAEEGELVCQLMTVEANGVPVPDDIIEPLSEENLLAKIETDSKVRKFVRNIEDVEIVGNKILIHPKPPKPDRADSGVDSEEDSVDEENTKSEISQ